VPNRRTRNRQLARVAQRRYAERRRQQRRRTRVIAAALSIGLIGLLVVFFNWRGNRSETAASGSPTPSASASGTEKVACQGSVPKAASVEKPQFEKAPPMTIDTSKTYTATIQTSCGTIEVELLADRASQTVNSFVFLADKHFFDGTQIHRIDPNLDVIQGGDPTATGTGSPGYTIPDELTGKETYGPGVVAMAKGAQPDTGGSQFFIVFGPGGRALDSSPNYTIFGAVVKGLDVAKRIGAVPVVDPQAAETGDIAAQKPKETVYLDKVTISTKG
jgi:peptidyl-prolyl cis-trans isomerase B (cyclophilin B)